jgi:hypothetical protein
MISPVMRLDQGSRLCDSVRHVRVRGLVRTEPCHASDVRRDREAPRPAPIAAPPSDERNLYVRLLTAMKPSLRMAAMAGRPWTMRAATKAMDPQSRFPVFAAR